MAGRTCGRCRFEVEKWWKWSWRDWDEVDGVKWDGKLIPGQRQNIVCSDFVSVRLVAPPRDR